MTTYCRSPIHYCTPDGTRAVDTDIADGRQAKTGLDVTGFELVDLPSAVTDWSDPEEIASVHHAEVAALVTERLACDAVAFYPAQLRGPDETAAGGKDFAPIEIAHADYTERYQAMLRTPRHPYLDAVRPSMAAAGLTSADLANASRVVTLQLWRNLGNPYPDRPLALCDTRTVDRSELTTHFVEEYAGRRTEFEAFLVSPPGTPGAHAWHTFPGMTADETLLFRAYDSDLANGGQPFWTPHAAFHDPSVDDDAPTRRSVELRAICVFT